MGMRGCAAAAVAVTIGWSGAARAAEMPAGAPRWVKVETTAPDSGGPAPRKHHSAVYDAAGHRVVIFGGRNFDRALDDTWSLDLKTHRWSQIEGDPRPAARFGATSVYDAPRRRMVLFSGQGEFGFTNDVWALDLERNRWSELKPRSEAGAPKVRYGGISVYDAGRERLVTFAGFTDEGRFNDTWAFDLQKEQWLDLSPGGTRPASRCLLSGEYDPLRDRMIIYAGQKSGHLEDTWSFDLAKNAWTEVTSSSRPPGRFWSSLVYHPERRRTILFGGQNSDQGALADTWMLNLDTDRWEPLPLAGDTKPAARNGHVAVYDPIGRRMLVSGGEGDELFSDVWALTDLAPQP